MQKYSKTSFTRPSINRGSALSEPPDLSEHSVLTALCARIIRKNSDETDDASLLCDACEVFGNSKFQITLDKEDLKCLSELGYDAKSVESAFGDNFKVIEDDPKINKFFQCSWRRSGFITKNDGINKTSLKTWLTGWDIRDLHDFFEVFGNSKFQITLDKEDLKCLSELGYDAKSVESAFGDNFKVIEDDPKINKFFQCSWRRSGFITKNDGINKTSLKTWLTGWDIRDLHDFFEVNNVQSLEELAGECINKCSDRMYREDDDYAVKIYNCLLDCVLWKRLT
ncbi:hypothetical protein FQA39_LY04388 [Lamprigera yunnana]|nr:hypothetical protein FQA39_LY04388 [Lamprigera yunnana]